MNAPVPFSASNRPRRAILFFLLLMLGTVAAQAQNNWTGNTNRDWNTASNWSAGIPTATSDVVIPTGPVNQPILSTAAVAKSVEVQTGASLSIASAGVLVINGSKSFTAPNLDPFTSAFYTAGSVRNSGQVVIGNASAASVGVYGLVNNGTFANQAGSQIAIDRSTIAGLLNAAGSFANSAGITIGAVAGVGSSGLYNTATFTNQGSGQLAIDRSTTYGLNNYAGSFTNSAGITIGAVAGGGVLGIFNNALFMNQGSGQIAIDRWTDYGLANNTGMSFTNSAVITIGAVAGVGQYGILNAGTFENRSGGQLAIDRSTIAGLINYEGSVTNSSAITIGALANVGNYGILNQGTATFSNLAGGSLAVDRTKTNAIFNNSSFTNEAAITIGAIAPVGTEGLTNQSTFKNQAGGTIRIDQATLIGLSNLSSGRFTNSATLTLGGTAPLAAVGLDNQGTFENQVGGTIRIDRSSSVGLLNTSNSSFTNSSTITMGATAAVGGTGLNNAGTFSNAGCEALLTIVADAVITNTGSFSNTGNLIENASGNSSISYNGGLVQNLNGGTFTITTNVGMLTTSPGPLPTITPTPSLTINQGQSVTLTASGAQTYSWSSGQSTSAISVSVAGPYSVTGTIGSSGCSYTNTATVTVNPVPTFTVSNPAICSGQYVNLGNSIGNKSPNNGDLTYYTTQANAQAGTNALISSLVGPVNTPTTYYARYDAAGLFSIQPIMVTLKPASPAPPALTQSGHAYTGGVSSVTVAQNSESVILAVPGCDGTVAWSGPNNFVSFNSTISVPTSTTGSFTYSASCTSQTACFSGSSQATVMVNVVVPVCGSVVYVTPGGAGSQNGSSWTNAFSGTALQTAINTAAGCGAQVWVASGLYTPATTLSMKNGVGIYGGFAGSETSRTSRVLSYPLSTTLSGGGVRQVFTNSDLDNTALLDGFVLANGKAEFGGAMSNTRSSPTLTNCSFQANSATNSGGAMYNFGLYNFGLNVGTSSPVLTNCSFQANSANLGGAMYNIGNGGTSSPVLTNCSFQANTATDVGGAMYNIGYTGTSSPVLTNCSFQANTATFGGTMYNTGLSGGQSSPVLANCVVFNNGGNNTFYNSSATVTATYSLFEPASTTLTGMNVSGPGNLTATVSPFASTTSVALTSCSPAINAGLTSANSTTVDLAGQPRLVGSRIDMGAVEYQGSTTLAVGITPNPSLTIGVGQSVTLTAAGADSYSWSSGESTMAISVSVAGPYTVTGVTGSCSGTATSLIVKPAPPIITSQPVGPTMVCLGGLVSVPVGVTNATSFQWITSTTPGSVQIAVAGQTSATLTLTNLQSTDAGYYYLLVAGPGGSTMSNGFSLMPTSPPLAFINANPSLTITQGQSTTLTATGASSFLWSTGDTSPAIPVSVAGPYSVTVSASGSGCFGSKTVVVSVTAPACGTVVYVTQSGAGLQDGSSWTNAFSGTALQTAINTAAGCGAQVWVARGLYKPTTTMDRTISFSMKKGVAIYGGFSGNGTETMVSQRNWTTNPTILSGDIDGTPDVVTGSGSTLSITGNGGNAYHVIYNQTNGLRADARLDGFTITGGNANGSDFPNNSGGGMYGSMVSPTVINCVFTGNTAATNGGGMYHAGYYDRNNNETPSGVVYMKVTNCTFSNNRATSGGGMYMYVGLNMTLDNVVFSKNAATGSNGIGGGLFLSDSRPTLSNVVFSENAAERWGGAISTFGTNAYIANGTFSNNTVAGTAPEDAGGISFSNDISTSLYLLNCVFWNNRIGNNTIKSLGRDRDVRYIYAANCDFQDLSSLTALNKTNCIDQDPQFVDAVDPDGPDNQWMTADDGLSLRASSPVINSGVSSIQTVGNSTNTLNAPSTDIVGNPRPYMNTAVDMGAYEFQGSTSLTLASSASPNPVCAGATTALSVTASGGTAGMPDQPYSYTWAAPAGITLSATSTSTVSASIGTGLSGPQTFTITVASSGGSPTSTSLVSVSVNAIPTVSITANPSLTITQGQSTILTASGATTYQWSTTETINPITVSPRTTVPYSVRGTTNGCSSVTTVTVTVNAPGCGAGLSGPIWTGCVSTDWNTAGNWASGTVPTATDDVVIPSAPANQPVLSTTAVAKSVAVQTGASLSISSAGSLTINSFATLGGFPTAFYNQGTVNNDGTLMLGNTAPVGLIGLHNTGTFTNTGTLQVDRATNQGINNRATATFTNTGIITIGASVSMGTQGIWNQATFIHTGGTITIDRITGDGLLNSGNFVNSATITIGASGSVTGNGIQVTGGSFQNNTGGFIQIDRTASHAIASSSTFTNAAIIKIGSLTTVSGRGLELGGTATFTNATGGDISLNRCGGVGMLGSPSFVNSSTLTIGDIAFSGQDNIYLGSGTFTNTVTGEIRADRAFGNGIWNIGGTFRNDGKIFIGSVANTGGTGILNTGTSFSNTVGALIQLDRTGRGLTNTTTFTNAGQIRMGNNVPLRSSGILNGNGSGNVAAVFNNLAGGLLQIDQTAAGQDGITNEVMTTFANAGTVSIGTSGSIGGNGITNAGTVFNSACAPLTVFAPINNSGSFTNAGLFTVGTTRPHTNTGTLTNNGIIDYPQGNPIPNVVNNDVIASAISSPTQTFSPALQLGGSSGQFTVGTTWYSDPALTQPAGTYNQGTNTFTATSLATGSSTTLYFAVTDNTAGCTRTVAISLMVVTPCGSVVYVTPTGAGSQNGSSWTNAFSGTALQTAINTAAGCGAQVWVAAGTYKPTTSTRPDSRTISFSMANGVAMYGGLTGTEPPGYNMALRDLTANKTTLSGDIDGVADVVTGSGSTLSIAGNDGNAYHVINNNNNGLTSSAILDGFTISGGNASVDGTVDALGAGMYNALVSPIIRNCTFYANTAFFAGGAMYNTSSTINLTNCRFLNNKAGVGGAIQTQARLSGVTVNHTLLNCSFTGNVGTTSAGAINHGFSNSQGQGLFDCTNCTFTNNYSFNGSNFGSAGAFFNEAVGFDARFTNCLFDGNKGLGTQADEGGGALLIYRGTATIINSTFVNNQAATKGGAIRIYQGQGTVNVKNSIFRNNAAPVDADISTEAGGVFTIQNSLLQVAACPPNVTCGPGMLYNQDPRFANPGAGNFQLTACSPAINAGDPATTSTIAGTTDLAGNPRFYTGTPAVVDMGAYEFQGDPSPATGITTQPVAGSTVCAGSTVTATVSVSGTGPLAYQWYRNGSTVSGQTTATLLLNNLQPGDTGSYSVVVTGACNSVTSTAFSLTVKPLPEPPTLVAADGQSTVTVSANTGDVVLTVSGCNGGQITWSGGGATTLAVSTATTGVFTYTATCQLNGCTSPLAIATVAVTSTSLRVLHRDASNGQLSTNAIYPYFMLDNVGSTPIAYQQITVRYWLTVENPAPVTNLPVYGAEMGAANVHPLYVALDPARPGATGYVEYRFDAGAGSLAGNRMSGSVNTAISKSDYSAFEQGDDYSFVLNRDFVPNPRMTAYVNGVLVWGTEPDGTGTPPAPAPLTLAVSASPATVLVGEATTLTARVGGGTLPYTYQFVGPGTIAVSGNTATVSGLSAGEYTFTVVVSDAGVPTRQTVQATVRVTVNTAPAPANTPPTTTANANQTATVGVGFRYTVNAFTDAETPDNLTYSARINPANGLTYNPVTRVLSGIPQTTGVSSVTITATDPGGLSTSTVFSVTVVEAPIGGATQLRVLHRDASNGQLSTNAIYPYFMLDNVGSTPIAYQQITVRYWLTVENPAPVTNLPVYGAEMGAANVHPLYVALDPAWPGATGYVEYRFDAGAGSLAGNRMSGSVNTAISKSDYSAFEQGDDYSFVLNRDFVPNPRMTAYVNGVLVWGTEPAVGARLGVESAEVPLTVRVLGNPVQGGELRVEVTGASGEPLRLRVTDLTGHLVSDQVVERAGAVEQQRLVIGQVSAGLLLLQVSTPTRSQTVKVLRVY